MRNLDHDLPPLERLLSRRFALDDKVLHKEGVNRLGNILIPNECYGDPRKEIAADDRRTLQRKKGMSAITHWK